MNGPLVEAVGAGRFRIRVIRAGLSGNGNFYPDAVLRQAVPLFEGVRVFVKGDAEHLAGQGKDFRNLIGRLTQVHFIEGAGADSGEVQAVLELLDRDGDEAVKLREAWTRAMTGLFGFSINAVCAVQPGSRGGKPARIATKFIEVKSVDLIVEPGAGGEVIGFAEAQGTVSMNYLSATLIDDMIAHSGLPVGIQKRLRKKLEGRDDVTEEELREAVKEYRGIALEVSEAGHVRLPDFLRGEVTESQDEKYAARLDAFFDPSHKDHRHAQSIREIYIDGTGDKRCTGFTTNCDAVCLRESLNSGSWPLVLGNSMHRALVRDYGNQTKYDLWQQIVDVVPVADFRNKEAVRFGGYGDLPAVAEGGAYLPLASPTDEKAIYAVSKRGGTEDMTLEMIKNDDVGSIRKIPTRLVRAAKRTLSKFVFDFIRTNPVIYDSLALFHATHGNLLAVPLTQANLAAARLIVLKQTEINSLDRIGVGPKGMIVPFDLEEAAVDLFRRNTNNDKNFVQSLTLDVLPVWYWTDVNDWTLYADPMDLPGIEIGFLDGQREPELFIQDMPSVGSMFSNDKVTYKIRHIYGGAVVDFRAFVKSVV